MYPSSISSRRMATGRVLPAFFISLLIATVGLYAGQMVPQVLMLPLMLVEIIMIFAASFVRKRQVGYGFLYSFTFLSGITLFPVISYYSHGLGANTVLEAFLVTVFAFGGASLYVITTKANFNFLGGFLFIGILALLGIGLVQLIFPAVAAGVNQVYTVLGILVFVGYILFDVSRITNYGVDEDQVPRVVLSLYLDFVNLFLFILRLFGLNVRRD
ncbi:MAG: hypothetical protein JWN30_2625 [Bacilli bacterium]|nr:hypothetical protein [Bacilli bacterium]